MDRIDDALALYSRGFSVLPAHLVDPDGRCSCRRDFCDAPGKHPRVRWAAFQERRATEQEVKAWWARWPRANIAVATGEVSGFIAVDIDPRHGGDEAIAAWQAENGELPPTWTVETGGGGTHYYFKWPGQRIRNGADVLPGVDLRGDGGYVIAAGSDHVSGGTYEWEVTGHPDEIDLAELPPPLLRLLLGVRSPLGSSIEVRNLDAIIEGNQRVEEGQRNDTMARIAGQLFSNAELGTADVLNMCLGINAKNFDPALDEREVGTIIESIGRREVRTREVETEVARRIDVAKPEGNDDLDREDRLDMAASIFAQLGVEAVTDWFVLLGKEERAYVLVTPENEVILGARILDYTRIRHQLADVLSVIAPPLKVMANRWPGLAGLLRTLAREEELEPQRASERLAEWLDAYTQRFVPAEWDVEMRGDALLSAPILIDNVIHLRPPHFRQFVEVNFGDELTTADVRAILKRSGWEGCVINIGGENQHAGLAARA